MLEIPTSLIVGIIGFILLITTLLLEEKWCVYMRPRVYKLNGWGIIGSVLMCLFWFVFSSVLIFIAVPSMITGIAHYL